MAIDSQDVVLGVAPLFHVTGEVAHRVTDVVDEPMFAPHINTAAMTYELAHDPLHEEIMTATSHLTGNKINRFTHIHQSIDDLVKKVRMMSPSRSENRDVFSALCRVRRP